MTHLRQIEVVFQCLLKTRLKLKEIKSNILKRHIQYLGHLISETGIKTLPESLSSLQDISPPRNLKEVIIGSLYQGLLTFCSLSLLLQRKTFPMKCTPKCQDSFNILKKYLIESPILNCPDPEKPYTLFNNASKYAWSCVLTQDYSYIIEVKERTILHPILYESGLV